MTVIKKIWTKFNLEELEFARNLFKDPSAIKNEQDKRIYERYYPLVLIENSHTNLIAASIIGYFTGDGQLTAKIKQKISHELLRLALVGMKVSPSLNSEKKSGLQNLLRDRWINWPPLIQRLKSAKVLIGNEKVDFRLLNAINLLIALDECKSNQDVRDKLKELQEQDKFTTSDAASLMVKVGPSSLTSGSSEDDVTRVLAQIGVRNQQFTDYLFNYVLKSQNFNQAIEFFIKDSFSANNQLKLDGLKSCTRIQITKNSDESISLATLSEDNAEGSLQDAAPTNLTLEISLSQGSQVEVKFTKIELSTRNIDDIKNIGKEYQKIILSYIRSGKALLKADLAYISQLRNEFLDNDFGVKNPKSHISTEQHIIMAWMYPEYCQHALTKMKTRSIFIPTLDDTTSNDNYYLVAQKHIAEEGFKKFIENYTELNELWSLHEKVEQAISANSAKPLSRYLESTSGVSSTNLAITLNRVEPKIRHKFVTNYSIMHVLKPADLSKLVLENEKTASQVLFPTRWTKIRAWWNGTQLPESLFTPSQHAQILKAHPQLWDKAYAKPGKIRGYLNPSRYLRNKLTHDELVNLVLDVDSKQEALKQILNDPALKTKVYINSSTEQLLSFYNQLSENEKNTFLADNTNKTKIFINDLALAETTHIDFLSSISPKQLIAHFYDLQVSTSDHLATRVGEILDKMEEILELDRDRYLELVSEIISALRTDKSDKLTIIFSRPKLMTELLRSKQFQAFFSEKYAQDNLYEHFSQKARVESQVELYCHSKNYAAYLTKHLEIFKKIISEASGQQIESMLNSKNSLDELRDTIATLCVSNIQLKQTVNQSPKIALELAVSSENYRKELLQNNDLMSRVFNAQDPNLNITLIVSLLLIDKAFLCYKIKENGFSDQPGLLGAEILKDSNGYNLITTIVEKDPNLLSKCLTIWEDSEALRERLLSSKKIIDFLKYSDNLALIQQLITCIKSDSQDKHDIIFYELILHNQKFLDEIVDNLNTTISLTVNERFDRASEFYTRQLSQKYVALCNKHTCEDAMATARKKHLSFNRLTQVFDGLPEVNQELANIQDKQNSINGLFGNSKNIVDGIIYSYSLDDIAELYSMTYSPIKAYFDTDESAIRNVLLQVFVSDAADTESEAQKNNYGKNNNRTADNDVASKYITLLETNPQLASSLVEPFVTTPVLRKSLEQYPKVVRAILNSILVSIDFDDTVITPLILTDEILTLLAKCSSSSLLFETFRTSSEKLAVLLKNQAFLVRIFEFLDEMPPENGDKREFIERKYNFFEFMFKSPKVLEIFFAQDVLCNYLIRMFKFIKKSETSLSLTCSSPNVQIDTIIFDKKIHSNLFDKLLAHINETLNNNSDNSVHTATPTSQPLPDLEVLLRTLQDPNNSQQTQPSMVRQPSVSRTRRRRGSDTSAEPQPLLNLQGTSIPTPPTQSVSSFFNDRDTTPPPRSAGTDPSVDRRPSF